MAGVGNTDVVLLRILSKKRVIQGDEIRIVHNHSYRLVAMGEQDECKDRKESDPLFMRMKYAAYDGLDEVRALLEEFPAALEARSLSGETALHWWAIEGHADAVKLLIEHGAKIDTRDDIIRVSPLMSVSMIGRTSMARLLIESGAEVCAVDTHGDTPLHHAAGSNRLDAVELLLCNGADALAKNELGETPLDVAKLMNAKDTYTFLAADKQQDSESN
jgi:ankyrin repeat protein